MPGGAVTDPGAVTQGALLPRNVLAPHPAGIEAEPVRSPQLFLGGADGQPLVFPAAPLR